MKIASSFLYDLVKRLTKSERRYIKVQAGDSEKDYIKLFDALVAQAQFDEEALIAENAGANFLKHLAVNKRYLYETLLNSLTQFGQQTLENKVSEKVNGVNVLIEKGLFKAALNELKKGRVIADKYELFGLQMMLSSIEKKLLTQQRLKKGVETADQIYHAELNRIAQLKNTNEYWYLTQQMVQFQTSFLKIQNAEQKQYIEALAQSPQLQDFSLATNFNSQLYFYQANAIYQFMLGNASEAYEINHQFLDLLESKPHFLRLYAQRYLATLNNLLIDSLVIGKYDALESGIERLVKMVERPEFKSVKNLESRVFRQRYLLLINWNLSQKNFKQALALIPQIEEGLEKFGKKIEKHHRITFYYLSAYLFFKNNCYDDSLHWISRILDESKEDVVKEIFYFARVLNLLIHFKLKNYDLVESLLLSIPKYLKSRRKLYETEKVLFKYIGNVMWEVDKVDRAQLEDTFKEKLKELGEVAGEKRFFAYLDLR